LGPDFGFQELISTAAFVQGWIPRLSASYHDQVKSNNKAIVWKVVKIHSTLPLGLYVARKSRKFSCSRKKLMEDSAGAQCVAKVLLNANDTTH
jgi:hypothetical protein